MVDFTITSEQECLIDGVGHVLPGEPVTVDPQLFEIIQGYPITEANFPHFVTVKEPKGKQESIKAKEGGE